ncbi:MAG: helix-turn-helix domain-containing protein [Phycisphaerales bacterium]|nr:MAG: helix-turn-helix domain-containing protein [Phycisphaerales bacterium]
MIPHTTNCAPETADSDDAMDTGGGCPKRGGEDLQMTWRREPFVYGEGADAAELCADVPLRTCTSCGHRFLDAAADDAQHEAVCRHLGVHSPAQIRALREKHGLSRAAFAGLTRLGEATIARWERGALIQNAAYDQFLFLLGFDDNIRRLQQRPASQDSIAPTRTRMKA